MNELGVHVFSLHFVYHMLLQISVFALGTTVTFLGYSCMPFSVVRWNTGTWS